MQSQVVIVGPAKVGKSTAYNYIVHIRKDQEKPRKESLK